MKLICLSVFLFAFIVLDVYGKKFILGDPLERDVIQFRVSAPLEDIVGSSSKISGWIEVNPNQVSQTKNGEFSAPSNSFATGIKMRDQHMFHSYIEAEKFPEITFKLESIEGAATSLEKILSPLKVKIHGTLFFHGVKRKMVFPATLSYFKENNQTRSKLGGNLLHLKVQFNFLLSDFLIKPPQIVSMQVGDEVEVFASLTATDTLNKNQPQASETTTPPPN